MAHRKVSSNVGEQLWFGVQCLQAIRTPKCIALKSGILRGLLSHAVNFLLKMAAEWVFEASTAEKGQDQRQI